MFMYVCIVLHSTIHFLPQFFPRHSFVTHRKQLCDLLLGPGPPFENHCSIVPKHKKATYISKPGAQERNKSIKKSCALSKLHKKYFRRQCRGLLTCSLKTRNYQYRMPRTPVLSLWCPNRYQCHFIFTQIMRTFKVPVCDNPL